MPRAATLLALSAVLVALAAGPSAAAAPEASAARACASFSFKQNGVPWSAKRIRARGVTCAVARDLIRAYAKPRNCQLGPRCQVGRWVCRTADARGSQFTERCTRGAWVVRWRGSYASR
jgi:hypothetical protein